MKETTKRVAEEITVVEVMTPKERIMKTKGVINGLQTEMISCVEQLKKDRKIIMDSIHIHDRVKFNGKNVEVLRKNLESVVLVDKNNMADNVYLEYVEFI